MTVENKKNFLINLLFASAVLFLIYLAYRYVLFLVFPFVIGLIIAAAVQKPVELLNKASRIPRKICAIICVMLTLGIVGVILWLFGSRIVSEIISLFMQVPEFVRTQWPGIYSNIATRLSAIFHALPPEIAEQVKEGANSMTGELTTTITRFATSVGTSIASFTASNLPNFLVNIIITIVSACFISMDYQRVKHFIYKQFPERFKPLVSDAKESFVSSIFKMLRAYLLLMLLTFVELAIGFTILGVDYAITIAFLVAIVDIMPILGTGTVLLPWAIIALLQGNFFMGFGILILYVVITVLRNILEPKIVGQSIGLHPLITLFFMFLGLQLIGVLGMFLFPMTIIILKNLQDSGKIHIWK